MNNKIDELINEKVKNNILNYNLISNNDKIVVGVSGGPDSMCLLDNLIILKNELKEKYNIGYSLVVAHVNHMIRKESENEKVYVENFAKNNNIPFYYLKKDVKKMANENKLSEETCGRMVRYDFFNKVLVEENASLIATAHNMDDDIETILLNLIRGTGLAGLSGMDYKHNNIIRPLIDIEKKDILLYNDLRKLNPCIDKTNFENIYARNKIRNLLIPMLQNEYNSNVKQNIIRMKKLVKKDEEFLEEYSKNILNKSIIVNNINGIKFNFESIISEHESIRGRVIRNLIQIKIGNLDGIGNVHINDIVKLLVNNIKGKKYIIGNKFRVEILQKNIAIIY